MQPNVSSSTILFERAGAPQKTGPSFTVNEIEETITLSKERSKNAKKKSNPHYLPNKELYNEVIECKEKGVMSDRLAKMLQLMCKNYTSRGGLYGYSYNDDMQAFAMLNLVKKWYKFNPERSTNAFSYFTECIQNSVKYYLKVEKHERNTRDKLMVNMGLNPSHTYQLDQENNGDE